MKKQNVCGPRVRKYRYCLKLSQRQLAEKAQTLGWDIGRDVIAKIENQSRCVTDVEVQHLARVLKVKASLLVD